MDSLSPMTGKGAWTLALDFLRKVWHGHRSRNQQRRELRYLAQMSEQQLKDIGLTPSERIERIHNPIWRR